MSLQTLFGEHRLTEKEKFWCHWMCWINCLPNHLPVLSLHYNPLWGLHQISHIRGFVNVTPGWAGFFFFFFFFPSGWPFKDCSWWKHLEGNLFPQIFTSLKSLLSQTFLTVKYIGPTDSSHCIQSSHYFLSRPASDPINTTGSTLATGPHRAKVFWEYIEK